LDKPANNLEPEFQRRDLFGMVGAAAVSAGVLGATDVLAAEKKEAPTDVAIKVAGYEYDRVSPIMGGDVGLSGSQVSFHRENIYSVNKYAFGTDQRYEVSEIGLIPFASKFANDDFRGYSLIPVFISRTFRHRNIFVHADSGIERPEDLRGKRVGTPSYGASSNTWIRGMLLDEYGVKAEDMHWIEATATSDGGVRNPGFAKYYFGDDFPLETGPPGVDESELLLDGGCDALITAITPKAFEEGNPKIRRLFPDVRATEQAYFRKTGLFPIMHVIGIRQGAIDADPDLPRAVFQMYSEAKKIAYANLETNTSLKVTLPWVAQEFEDTRKLMGSNFWPYGIEANRKELELVMRYTHEQGLAKRKLAVEDIFHPSTLDLIES
jgi:4,5-dihydroxyphthalate decarboxylase